MVFLAENADFAEQVEKVGFVFIGPTAKAFVLWVIKYLLSQQCKAGVPCVPGSDGPLTDDEERNMHMLSVLVTR